MGSHSLQVPRPMRSNRQPLSAILGWVAFVLLLVKFASYGHAQSPAALVILNAHVVTCDDQLRRFEAVAIWRGLIAILPIRRVDESCVTPKGTPSASSLKMHNR